MTRTRPADSGRVSGDKGAIFDGIKWQRGREEQTGFTEMP